MCQLQVLGTSTAQGTLRTEGGGFTWSVAAAAREGRSLTPTPSSCPDTPEGLELDQGWGQQAGSGTRRAGQEDREEEGQRGDPQGGHWVLEEKERQHAPWGQLMSEDQAAWTVT